MSALRCLVPARLQYATLAGQALRTLEIIGQDAEVATIGELDAAEISLVGGKDVCRAVASPNTPNTITVNFTGDTGDQAPSGVCNTASFPVGTEPECTLRAAIEEANATTGTDIINFDIGGSGVHTISPASSLPIITQRVTIDGYTESGASENTQAVGSNAVLRIRLDGSDAGSARNIISGNSIGVEISGGGGNKMQDNYM